MIRNNFVLLVDQTKDSFSVNVKELSLDDLHQGDVDHSCRLFKLKLQRCLGHFATGKIAKVYPLIPGVDFAGTVVTSNHPNLKKGMKSFLLVAEIGVSHHGGFSEYHGSWQLACFLAKRIKYETGNDFRERQDLLRRYLFIVRGKWINPEKGPILMDRCFRGVGSLAVAMLAKRQYEVVASTGKETAFDFLRKLGQMKF